MTKFSYKLKKQTIFGLLVAHFPLFEGKRSFSKKKSGYVTQNVIRDSSTIPKFWEI